MSEVIARIAPSAPRRWFAVSVMAAVGVVLIYIVLVRPPDGRLWPTFLFAVGVGSLWLAWRVWQATATAIELLENELRDTVGRVICRLDDIDRVEIGVFALKPTNGFLLKLKHSGPRAWQPGLWWRFGHRVGVGGVTAGSEARAMAEVISAMVERRDAAR